MFCIDSITGFSEDASKVRRWRSGRIVMRDGRLDRIERRLTVGAVSVAQVWWQSRYRGLTGNVCQLDYHQPFGMPGFLTLDYIRGGDACSYKTFAGACHVLDQIARERQAQAIVANITNQAISDRFLQRMGWQQHLDTWSGRHWIRRFYDGYPNTDLSRYA